MAQKKKPATKAKTSKKNKRNTTVKNEPEKYIPTEQDLKIRNEVKLLASLGVMILLFISNFGLISPVGDYISYFMFGMTGVIAYLLPVLIFVGTAFLLSNKNNKRALTKFFAALAIGILIACLIQLIFLGYQDSRNCFFYYFFCGENKVGGGFLAALIVNTLCHVVGKAGAGIVLVLLLIIAGIILTERSFIGGVKKGSRKVYDTAKEDVWKIRESGRERVKEREYQNNRRIHKVVKGVNLNRIEDPARPDEAMHEIDEKTFVEEESSKPPVALIQPVVRKKKQTMSQRSLMIQLVPEEQAEEILPQKELVEADLPREQEEVRPQMRQKELPQSFQKFANATMVKKVEAIDVEQEEEKTEKVYIDEEGNFKPKEQILVSKEAKKVMNRPAFAGMTGGRMGDTKNADGMVKIATANVENSVYEAKKTVAPRKTDNQYSLPETDLLNRNQERNHVDLEILQETAQKLEVILQNFGVKASVTDFHRGPSVTRYEILPEIGTRLNKITTLADDIKLNLAATDIRIEPIAGKSTIGIEVPNKERESVLIRDLIESKELVSQKSKLAFAAGKDIAGQVIVADIAKMPHFLIAGTTGSGKSVFTNSIIMSILFRATPDEVRLIIVDPKVVEFGIYNGIPHLLQPVVTEPKMAANTLKWAVAEMQNRYQKFLDMGVRDLGGYNKKIEGMNFETEKERLEKLPQILIVIDELADLMMVAAKEVEEYICRLAQKARAAGIHLIIATQRPSVDVVTGLIKANIPSRCALMVSSGVDSRTILDSVGAERLLGNGDMLFYPSGYVKPVRLQGAFVSDAEVQRVVDYWIEQGNGTNYDEKIVAYVSKAEEGEVSEKEEKSRDDYFEEAARLVTEKEKASTSMLQRFFKIGFNRAARIIDQLAQAGIIGEEEGTKPRKVLVDKTQLEDLLNHLN